MLKTGRKSS